MINTQTPFLALLGEICWLSVGGGVGPRTFITRSLAMSWEAKARFLGLSWETVSRTSSGKFLRVESCYPESFGFLRLWVLALQLCTCSLFLSVSVCLCAPKHNYKFSRWRVWWFVRGKERWRRESWAKGWGLEGKSSHTNTHKHSHTNAYAFKDNYDKHYHKTC